MMTDNVHQLSEPRSKVLPAKSDTNNNDNGHNINYNNNNYNDNNNNHNNNNDNSIDIINDALTPSIRAAYKKLATERAILEYKLEAQPIAGIGENAYGLIMQVSLIPLRTAATLVAVPTFHSILKIAPKSPARRQHMRVADYYRREVFMYAKVLQKFRELSAALTRVPAAHSHMVPAMYAHSLACNDEFIIFEDLLQRGYVQNARTQMPTFELVNAAIKALAQLHAMSFVLQSSEPETFDAYTQQMQDNLFDNIEQVSVEFAKNYVGRTRNMLLAEPPTAAGVHGERLLMAKICTQVERHFKEISLRCVNGRASRPYAVICHGDFWNNNIMYKYGPANADPIAKLIDFQMSRYAPPVLDLVHYLFACTERELRDAHFDTIMNNYYATLTEHIRSHQLDPAVLYPRAIFDSQLQEFGIYGFCMSAFAIPFFISNTNELLDLDVVSEAIDNLSASSSSSTASAHKTNTLRTLCTESDCDSPAASGDEDDETVRCRQLVESYDMLTARTIPIFKRRMLGILADLIKYNMFQSVMHL